MAFKTFEIAGKNLVMSRDKKMLVQKDKDDGSVALLIEIESGKTVQTLKGHEEEIVSPSFSFERKKIITNSEDDTAKIWSTQTSKEHLSIKGIFGPIFALAFSPDATKVVTCSSNQIFLFLRAKQHEISIKMLFLMLLKKRCQASFLL